MNLQAYIEKHGNVEVDEKQLNGLLGVKEAKVFRPQNGQGYWFITEFGGIESTRWTNDTKDQWRYASGNCYQSHKAAEFGKERILVTVELEQYAKEHDEGKIDWKNCNQRKWYLSYDYDICDLAFNNDVLSRLSTIYFTSFDIMKQAIADVGEERIKKYYLWVED